MIEAVYLSGGRERPPMAVYEYVALDEKGRRRTRFYRRYGCRRGAPETPREGVYPVEISPAAEKKDGAGTGVLNINLWQRVGAKEVSIFTVNSRHFWAQEFHWCLHCLFWLRRQKNPLLKNAGANSRAGQ